MANTNSGIVPLVQDTFYGGWSTSRKLGGPGSFAYSQSVDFRKNPSALSILPGTRKESGSVVVDLVQNEVMVNDGTIYALGSAGNFYQRTTAGVWSSIAKLNTVGTFGLSYRQDTDAIYITGTNTVSQYNNIGNAPSIKVDKFAASASTDALCYLWGGVKTTAILTAFTENNNQRHEYQPDIEPLIKFAINIVAKGTGDWTLTLHDGEDNVLGTVTKANATLSSNDINFFEFSSQIRQYVKPNARTYHFHLTSTVADGTVASSTTDDLSTCDFQYWADRLIITNNGMHPQATFLQYQTFGNANYLSVWEPIQNDPSNAEWERHRLTFPAGLEVCGLANYNEYLAIACEYRTSSATITGQEGYIFLWDGVSVTYNYYIKVPEGSPYSLHDYKNVLYFIAGGAWYGYTSGAPVKLRTLPGTDSEYSDAVDKTVIYPNMATVRRGIHLLGFPSYTTNESIEHGVYSYGSIDKNFPETFGYSYTISTGTKLNTSGNLKVGMVKNFGDTLHISWQDGASNFGVDVVDNNSDPFSTARWEGRSFDAGIDTKTKTAVRVEGSWGTLIAGQSVQLMYKLDDDDWVISDTFTTDDGIYGALYINERFYSMQIGVILNATDTTPYFNCVTLVYNTNVAEQEG